MDGGALAVSDATSSARRAVAIAHDWTAWESLQPLWKTLESAAPSASAFLSAAWVDAWLHVFGQDLAPTILVFHNNTPSRTGEPIGICVVNTQVERWRRLALRRVFLHTNGEPEDDETMPEQNAILCLPGWDRAVVDALRRHLNTWEWDEFHAPALRDGEQPAVLTEVFGDADVERRDQASHYVDLASLRLGQPYLSTLSRNSREQVRRSLRLFEAIGPLWLDEARDTTTALTMLRELADLHQPWWNQRGRPGAFASARFCAFHRRFIERAFPEGSVQLLRIRAGDQPIGLLYNLVHAGQVSFYQSGLLRTDDPRMKPGLIAHALAIEHCRGAGFREYDFLAGDSQYKRSLATSSRRLVWLTARRLTLRSRAFDSLRKLRTAVATKWPLR